MWHLYDNIIDEVPRDLDAPVDFIHVGDTWTILIAGKYTGVAVTVNEQGGAIRDYACLYGMQLREVARLCKSWDFTDASVGTAALNAYLSSPEHITAHTDTSDGIAHINGFDAYRTEASGKKVAIIGHFRQLERFLPESDVYVLERRPEPGDYPDSACEYILPDMDYVFITGSAFVNKTLPRLLQLSKRAVVLGPSTPMSRHILDFGAIELNGYSPRTITQKNAEAIGSGDVRLSKYGVRFSMR